MILADTSAWIEFDRATGSRTDLRIKDLIETTDELAVTEPVLMEVLAGARSEERARQLRRLFSRFDLLALEPVADFEGAAAIYRRCRRAGVTPRGLLDCMIAAVSLRTGASLLTHDANSSRIAPLNGIHLDDASLI